MGCDGSFEGLRKENKLQREDEAAMDYFVDWSAKTCRPSDFGVILFSGFFYFFFFWEG